MIKAMVWVCFCLLAACSNQQMYQAIQENRQQECRRNAPNEAVYEDCLKSNSQSYEEYERQRQVLLD